MCVLIKYANVSRDKIEFSTRIYFHLVKLFVQITEYIRKKYHIVTYTNRYKDDERKMYIAYNPLAEEKRFTVMEMVYFVQKLRYFVQMIKIPWPNECTEFVIYRFSMGTIIYK